MLNVAKVAAKMSDISKGIAKMNEDALVNAMNFRLGVARLLSHVLGLPWAKHMHEFKPGFQASRETLVKENAKMPWAKVLYQHDAFGVVQVNPFPAVGPNKGGHFRASMKKKYGTQRFDKLLQRNAIQRILTPSYHSRFDDSESAWETAWESQTNQYWQNARFDTLRVIGRPELETQIKCLAAFEEDPQGVWVRTEMTQEAIVVDVLKVLRWVAEKKRMEHENIEKYQKLANKIEDNLKAQNPDTFQTPKDKRDMIDAMKACIHRDANEKRWANEATEAAAAAEAAAVAKKAAKAAKKTRGKK